MEKLNLEEVEIIESESNDIESPDIFQDLTANEFIQMYKERFSQNSIDNEHLATSSLHCITGTLLRHSRIWFGNEYIDLRISPISLQDSGSGKTPAFNFTKELAEELEIAATKVSKMTIAAGMGSVIPKEVLNEETGEYEEKIGQRQGDFDKYHLMMFNEGNELLEDPEMIRCVCEVLDPIGRNEMNKSLAQTEEEIKSQPETTIFVVTFVEKSTVSDIILKSGLAPRCLLFFKEKSLKQKSDVNLQIIKRLGKKIDLHENRYDTIVERLKNVRDYFSEGAEFTFTDKSIEMLEAFNNAMIKEISILPPIVQKSLTVFVTRYLLLCPRLAAHHAAFEYRSLIKTQDIKYGIGILKETWDELIEFTELSLKLTSTIKDEVERSIINITFESGEKGAKLRTLREQCIDKHSISQKTLKRRIDVLLDSDYIIETRIGKEKAYKITPAGKKLFKTSK